MPPSSLTLGIMHIPHPEDLNLDLLADALFPLIENDEQPESEHDLVSRVMAGSPGQHVNEIEREPRSVLLQRVKNGLEPDIEPCVCVSKYVAGWSPCLMVPGMVADTRVSIRHNAVLMLIFLISVSTAVSRTLAHQRGRNTGGTLCATAGLRGIRFCLFGARDWKRSIGGHRSILAGLLQCTLQSSSDPNPLL